MKNQDAPHESVPGMFMRILGVPTAAAEALTSAEVTSIEELANIPLDQLLAVRAVEYWLLLELRDRARHYLQVH